VLRVNYVPSCFLSLSGFMGCAVQTMNPQERIHEVEVHLALCDIVELPPVQLVS